MRIVAGQYKGKKLVAGNDLAIRPITTKIKESVFNTLGNLVIDKDVLDLFSGSGSFGLEALSRGAQSVTFVDQAGSSIQILSKNLQSFQIPPDQFEIHNLNVQSYIQTHSRSYELILMDPPFNFSLLQKLVEEICNIPILADRGILVLHHEVSNSIDHNSDIYELFKQKKFGRNLVSYILRKDHDVK
jgi:16S rRNA (guanine966-N2)-methyltransferase